MTDINYPAFFQFMSTVSKLRMRSAKLAQRLQCHTEYSNIENYWEIAPEDQGSIIELELFTDFKCGDKNYTVSVDLKFFTDVITADAYLYNREQYGNHTEEVYFESKSITPARIVEEVNEIYCFIEGKLGFGS